MLRLTARTQLIFYTSLVLAVFSVVLRLTNDAVDGYGLLLVAYIVLFTGLAVKGEREKPKEDLEALNLSNARHKAEDTSP